MLQKRSGMMRHLQGEVAEALRSLLEVVQRAFGCNARTKRGARIVRFNLFFPSNSLTVILEDTQ